MFKQVIVIRADLKLGKGKIAAQAAHASLGAYRNAPVRARESWEETGEKKVVVKVNSIDELTSLQKKARALGVPCALIRDAGKTQTEPGTVTALGFGPAEENLLDLLTGKLKLM